MIRNRWIHAVFLLASACGDDDGNDAAPPPKDAATTTERDSGRDGSVDASAIVDARADATQDSGRNAGTVVTSLAGTVASCDGDGCPTGACDDFLGPECDTLYMKPFDATTNLCAASATAKYCLELADDYYVVNCTSSKPKIERCVSGCQMIGASPYECL